MLKLLIVHPALAPYRIDFFNALNRFFETRIIFLRKNLLNQRFDSDALFRNLSCDYNFLEKKIDLKGRVIPIGLVEEIEAFAPRVIVTYEFSFSSLFCVGRRFLGKSEKLVVWTDDSLDICNNISLARRLAQKIVLKGMDGLIVSSDKVQQWYQGHGVTKKIGISPIIQDEDALRARMKNSVSITKEFVKNYELAGKKIILYVGRLAQEKGLDRLIFAFRKTLVIHPNTLLVLIGDGPQKDFLQSLVEDSGIEGKVLFAGRFEDVELAAWYRLGSFFVLVSHHEPFGAVVNEALLAGMPVICSKLAGASCLIRHGKNGYLVDPFAVSRISAYMTRLLDHSPPITNKIKPLRPSLMSITFQSSVDNFVNTIIGVV